VNGLKIRPVDVTAKLLFPKWKLKKGEEETNIAYIVKYLSERGVNYKIIVKK